MNEILIYGDIGFEVQAKDIVSQLNDMEGAVDVRVDSYGGDVYAGISILNALRRYPDEVVVYVDGMAASAASFIAVGGADKLVMSPNSSLLIHGAWSQGMGNSEEMAQLSAYLNQVTDTMATIYAEKTGKESSYWRELMKKDTTFTAEQAVESGLADMVGEFEKSAQASKRHAVMASHKSRFAANHGGVPEIESRAAAPPPPLARRSESANHNQKKGDTVSILNQLAQELGKEPEDVEKALTGFFNEEITVTATVDISYPEISTVSPTDKITIYPEGEVPAGVVFAAGEAPEGWTVEVDESTGAVTVTAPSGVEPGDKVDIPVTVSGADNDNPTELNVAVEVKAAAQEDEPDTSKSPASDDVVEVPRAMYDMLAAAYEANHEQVEANAAKAREEAVDKWIAEGRFSAALRSKAIEAMNADESAAHKVWGALPKGKINRAEKGYTISKMPDTVSESSTKEDRLAEWLAKAEQRASAQK